MKKDNLNIRVLSAQLVGGLRAVQHCIKSGAEADHISDAIDEAADIADTLLAKINGVRVDEDQDLAQPITARIDIAIADVRAARGSLVWASKIYKDRDDINRILTQDIDNLTRVADLLNEFKGNAGDAEEADYDGSDENQ
jgi:hypothetical protein